MSRGGISIREVYWRLWKDRRKVRCFCTPKAANDHILKHLRQSRSDPVGREAAVWESCRSKRLGNRPAIGESEAVDYVTWIELIEEAFTFADLILLAIRYNDHAFRVITDMTDSGYPKGVSKRKPSFRFRLTSPWGFFAIAAQGSGTEDSALLLTAMIPDEVLDAPPLSYDAFRRLADYTALAFSAGRGRMDLSTLEYREISDVEFLGEPNWWVSIWQGQWKDWLRRWESGGRTAEQSEGPTERNTATDDVRETGLARYLKKWGPREIVGR